MQLKMRTTAPSRQAHSIAPQISPEAAIKPIIMRLETALGRQNLAENIVLLLRSKPPVIGPNVDEQTINFVVGYSGSTHSQAALDLALCAAYQTRLAKPNPVHVHVVYVVDKTRPRTIANADRILWQARCLASEWRGSLNAHLRVGQVATELSQVAKDLGAEVLLVGCHTAKHRLVQQLKPQTPCSVLGLP